MKVRGWLISSPRKTDYSEWFLLGLCIFVALATSILTGLFGIMPGMIILIGIPVLVVALFRLDWIMAFLLSISPLYFLIKLWLPSIIGSVWRDLLLGITLGVWVLLMLLRAKKKLKLGVLTNQKIIMVAVTLFGIFVAIQIFNSDSLITGILGFRTLFRFLPIYFVSITLLSNHHKIVKTRYFLSAFLIGALINIFAGVLQSIFISFLKLMPPGTWFDPIRLTSLSNGLAMSRFGMQRVIGFWGDPNDFGQLAVVALAIMLPRTMRFHTVRSWRLFYKFLCYMTGIAIIGTLAVFAIMPALVILVLFFASVANRKYRSIILTISLLLILVMIVLLFFILTGPIAELGYTLENVVASFSYLPQAFSEGNLLGQGYGIYSDLAERFNISAGSTSDRATYWFYFDQLAVQIGLLGIILWMGLWAIFLLRGYRNLFRISRNSANFQVSLSVWLALVGLFLSSLHYGPYRVGGVDMLLYVLWGFVSTSPSLDNHDRLKDHLSPISESSNLIVS